MSRLLHLERGSTFAEDYRVVGPLAEGGMGAIYEVTQVHTGAGRALKIMHPQLVGDDKARQRFVQEAKVSALIESDHVVQVTGAGVDVRSGTPWLAMTQRDLLDEVCGALERDPLAIIAPPGMPKIP